VKKPILILLAASFAFVALAQTPSLSYSLSPPAPEGLRDGGTLGKVLPAPPIANDPSAVERQVRNYPEQPPVIPHSIRGYQLDKRFNRCLDCHSRQAAPSAGAPMVSVTHFMDRNFQVLAEVTPARYFCTQCHVPQTEAEAMVESDFETIDQVIRQELKGESQ
jgi:nitrate reductase (cytochrome), electron transfer subunit